MGWNYGLGDYLMLHPGQVAFHPCIQIFASITLVPGGLKCLLSVRNFLKYITCMVGLILLMFSESILAKLSWTHGSPSSQVCSSEWFRERDGQLW